MALFLCFSFIILYNCQAKFQEKSTSCGIKDFKINTAEDALLFIESLGWKVYEKPEDIREIILPVKPDDVFNNYNKIQNSQDYDLTDYFGKKVKKWTFTIKNYPGYENQDIIKINILTYKGEVVGGDVCSVKLDGFMHGFKKENENG